MLVNNAGYSQSGAVETIAMDDLRRQFETNVFGLVRMCQLVLPGMRARANRPDRQHAARWAPTSRSPAAARTTRPSTRWRRLSDALRFEVKGFGVGVTVVQPGLDPQRVRQHRSPVRSRPATGRTPSSTPTVGRATQDAYTKGPLARFGGTPEDVAEAVEAVIDARKAPIRVRVTASARILIAQRRLLSDAMWDRFLRTQFPRPRVG